MVLSDSDSDNSDSVDYGLDLAILQSLEETNAKAKKELLPPLPPPLPLPPVTRKPRGDDKQ